jgi:hypothetical protein
VDTCVEKREISDRGSFCSFAIKDGVAYKDPVVLFRRLMIHLTRGAVDNIALGYMDLFAVNYNLGDKIYEAMTPLEMEHHAAVKHIMFNLKKYGYTGPKIDYDKFDTTMYDNDKPTQEQATNMVQVVSDIVTQAGEIFSPKPYDNVNEYDLAQW